MLGLPPKSNMSIPEYSQWNSGFALSQSMYSQQNPLQLGSSAFVDSFFSSGSGSTIPHHSMHQSTQPSRSFEYSNFGGLGNLSNPGSLLTSPTTEASSGSLGAIGGNRHLQQQQQYHFQQSGYSAMKDNDKSNFNKFM
jgi:hypothetical protein